MQTIQIAVKSEEFETINIDLTSEEVSALYALRKENSVKIAELEKKIKDIETSKKYSEDKLKESDNELSQANTLLSALGVAEKTNEEEAYYRKSLSVTTRIALYIANKQ